MTEPIRQQALLKRVQVALFVGALYVPFVGHFARWDQSANLGENRALAAAPRMPSSLAEMPGWPKGIEAWWNDNFGFRQQLIRAHAVVKLELSASSSNEVVVGKDGWLIYTGNASIPTFRGLRPMRPDELLAQQHELERRRDWLESLGIKFIYVVAPNKETIYPEKVPGRYTRAGPTRFDQLIAHMKANSNFEIVDLRPVLMAHKDEGALYHKTDTHWTDLGSLYGYLELQRRISVLFPQLQQRSRDQFKLVEAPPFAGDLSAMLAMTDRLKNDRQEVVPVAGYTAVERTQGGFVRNGVNRAIFESSSSGPRAVVLHDSFFLKPEERQAPIEDHQSPSSVVRFLAEDFSHAYFTWTGNFDPALIMQEKPDIVIEEAVERFAVDGLQGRAPAVSAAQ